MTISQPLTAFLEQSQEFHNGSAKIYTALDTRKSQIRLVKIQPAAQDSEDIHLTLEVVSLDDPPVFQAISYTWGSRSTLAKVYLHGQAYSVTQNQYEALRRFRQVDRVRVVWMDVLSINQDNVAEKSSQVSMMSRIYSVSQQTQIWLGETDRECTRGFGDDEWSKVQTWYWTRRDRDKTVEMLTLEYENEEFSHRTERLATLNKIVDQTDGIIYGAIHILELLSSDLHLWQLPCSYLDASGNAQLSRPWFESMQALKAILRKPYWQRVWTVQEAILSPLDANVHIGRFEVPLSRFLELGGCISEHVATSVACCGVLADMIAYEDDNIDDDSLLFYTGRCVAMFAHLRDYKRGQMGFDEAIGLSNQMEAFDARDYVYGVLGFVADDCRPDVEYSLSASMVFQLGTRFCWASRGSLGFLKLGSIDTKDRMPNLPSWCIDFTNSDTISFKFYESWFENEVPDWESLDFDLDQGRIALQGFPVGDLKLVFERSGEPTTNPSDVNVRIVTDWLLQIEEAKLESNVALDPRTNKSFFRRFFDTIFRDTVFELNDRNANIQRLTETDWEEIADWWEVASQGSAVGQWNSDRQNEAQTRIRRSSLAFVLGLRDSTFAVTSKDEFAMVPLAAKPGDQLFHITGCCMPLVLREVEPASVQVDAEVAGAPPSEGGINATEPAIRTFRIVGPCYIKGLMGSLGFQNVQSGPLALV